MKSAAADEKRNLRHNVNAKGIGIRFLAALAMTFCLSDMIMHDKYKTHLSKQPGTYDAEGTTDRLARTLARNTAKAKASRMAPPR